MTDSASDVRRNRRKRAARALLYGLLGLPLAVLTHELGHFLAYRAFGIRDVTLHFASVSAPAEESFWKLMDHGRPAEAVAEVPAAQIATAAAAGIAITYFTVFGCLAQVMRGQRAHPLALAVGLAAPLRFLVGVPTVLAMARGQSLRAANDEGYLSRLLGASPRLFASVGLATLAASYVVFAFVMRPPIRPPPMGRTRADQTTSRCVTM